MREYNFQPMARVIAFDTETTGLQSHEGHRIVSFAAVELVWNEKNPRGGLRPTGRTLDLRFNPEREIDPAASKVNGFTLEMLQQEPKFLECVPKIINFIRGAAGDPQAVLVAHNAKFDIGMMNAEMRRAGHHAWLKEADVVGIIDTKHASAKQWLGQKDEKGKRLSHSLDAVCTRLGIDLSPRADGHGALVDTKLLAEALTQIVALEGGHRSVAEAGLYQSAMSSPRSTSDFTGNVKREFSKEWIAAADVVAPHLAGNDKFKRQLSNNPKPFILNPQSQVTSTVAIGEVIGAALDSEEGKSLPETTQAMLRSIQEQALDPKVDSTIAEQFAQLCQQTLVDSQPKPEGKALNSRMFYLQNGDNERIYGKGAAVTFVAGITGKKAVEVTSSEVAQHILTSMSVGDKSLMVQKHGQQFEGAGYNVMALGRLMDNPAETVEEHVHAMTAGKVMIKFFGKQFIKDFAEGVREDVCDALLAEGYHHSAPNDAQAAFRAAMEKAFSPLGEKFLATQEITLQDFPPAMLLQEAISTAQRVVNPGVGLYGETMHRAALETDKALRDMEAELRTETARRLCDPATPTDGPTLLELAQKIAPHPYKEDGLDPRKEAFLDLVQGMLLEACQRTPPQIRPSSELLFEQRVLKQGSNFDSVINIAEQHVREQNNARRQDFLENKIVQLRQDTPAATTAETYHPPAPLVRMLLPKEQIKLYEQERHANQELEGAKRANDTAFAALDAEINNGNYMPGDVPKGKALNLYRAQLETELREAECRISHQTAHGEFFASCSQAVSDHILALQESRDGYLARYWKEQFGVKREQLPKEQAKQVEATHENILVALNTLAQPGSQTPEDEAKRQAARESLPQDARSYSALLQETFHKLNPTLPQDIEFSGYPMPIGRQEPPKPTAQRPKPDAPKPSAPPPQFVA